MSNAAQALWTFMAIACSLGAFAFVLADDSSTAFTFALSGLGFFLMSHARHDDLDPF